MWTAESSVFIQNEAGHSLSFVKSYLCRLEWRKRLSGSDSQCRLLLGPCPSHFPSSCALRWADRKSCQSGCQSLQRAPSRGHSGLVCSALRWGRCQQLPGRELGVCLHLTSLLATSGAELVFFNPCLHQSGRMTAQKCLSSLASIFAKGQIRSFLP